MKRGRRLGALLALAALAGCSAIKLGYNRLDWIVAWQIGRLVDLDAPQKALFDERFGKLWLWHRGTQLPLYVRDLRELATTAGAPLSTAQVENYLQRTQDHVDRMLHEIVPGTAGIVHTFDDEQVTELLDHLAGRRRDQAKESADLGLEGLQDEAQDQMVRSLKRWIGPLNREQKARIGEWSRQRTYAGALWQQYEEAWAGAFSDVLARRREADFQARFEMLFDDARVPYGEELAKVRAHNRVVWVQAMADLSAQLTLEQRAHLQSRLRDLADQLSELASENRQAALPGPIG